MRQITKDFKKLKDNDIISMLLYCLYKLKDDDKYAAISELAYVLDKDNLYKLCSVYGGTTIKIPTLEEFETVAKVLLVIELMSNGLTFDEAYEEADIDIKSRDESLKIYELLSTIIEDFEIEN